MSNENSKLDAERAVFEAAFEGVFFSSCFEREDDGSYAGRGLQGAWLGWQKARSLPVGVPDGLFLGDALLMWNRRHDNPPIKVGYEYGVADALLQIMAAPAAPTVKAEQSCPVCDGAGELYHPHAADEYRCESCDGTGSVEVAPSLPAAGSSDLTAVRCQCCATEYPHDSYDAGFIAGSGMCQVCDAAMPPKDLPAAGSADLADAIEIARRNLSNAIEDVEDGKTVAALPALREAAHFLAQAALSAQQSAPERVSLPVELAARLQRFCQRPHSSRDEADALDMELRALLASHAEGGKV